MGLLVFAIAEILRIVPMVQALQTMGRAFGMTVNRASVYFGNVLSRHGDALDWSGFEVMKLIITSREMLKFSFAQKDY